MGVLSPQSISEGRPGAVPTTGYYRAAGGTTNSRSFSYRLMWPCKGGGFCYVLAPQGFQSIWPMASTAFASRRLRVRSPSSPLDVSLAERKA